MYIGLIVFYTGILIIKLLILKYTFLLDFNTLAVIYQLYLLATFAITIQRDGYCILSTTHIVLDR